MTNRTYPLSTIILFILCLAGLAGCFLLCVELIAVRTELAEASAVLLGSADTTAPVAFGALGWTGLDFRNLERFPETIEELAPNTRNPEKAIALNKRINAQSDRLEALFADIASNPKAVHFGYEGILPWRERQAYQKRTAQAKAEALRYKAEALEEAREADEDEEFVEGYKEFLANEFSNS